MSRNTYLAAPFRRSRSSSRASGLCGARAPRCSRNLLFRITVAAARSPAISRAAGCYVNRAREKKARLYEETRRILATLPASPPPLSPRWSLPSPVRILDNRARCNREVTILNSKERELEYFRKKQADRPAKIEDINKSRFQDLFQV